MKYFLTHVLSDNAEAMWEPGLEGRLRSWVAEMEHRGVVLDGAPLRMDVPATTVRRAPSGVTVADGPFAETKEQVAGYDLIEVANLDEAIAVAAAHPTTEVGAIEIRPVAPGMPSPIASAPREGRQRYLMLVCWDQSDDAEITSDPVGESPVQNWIAQAGDRRLHGWQLQPPALATTVRRDASGTVVIDGPFAETKEQIGGYDFLECADLAEAIEIAKGHGSAVLDLRLCTDLDEIWATA